MHAGDECDSKGLTIGWLHLRVQGLKLLRVVTFLSRSVGRPMYVKMDCLTIVAFATCSLLRQCLM